MRNIILIRLLLIILILLAVILGWWHIAIILGMIGCLSQKLFLEFIVGGIVFDALYGHSESASLNNHLGIIISLVLFVVIYWLKKVLRR
jgi:hypothetical protein